ncbi:MAG: alpha/beta fold hydrolase [Trueperaceae bacterium]|nr:alpha/beta fold hydrolase [Trueperaceae bacterium]
MTTVRTVRISEGDATLEGDLALFEDARGVVLFAHGSGSSRHSPRNRFVAEHLNQAGFATVLLDLLTEDEERVDARSGQHRFDIDLLARRLEAAVSWLGEEPDTRALSLGLFGASTGAAAALVTAARRPDAVRAVVSRGGRPDLAGDDLGRVTAPTCLIVGGLDVTVLELNESAQRAMRCETRLDVVPGATHLFEEPGALEHVADLARDWFLAEPGGSRHAGDALISDVA